MNNVSIAIKIDKERLLMDRRVGRRGLILGTVGTLANQYGVTMAESNGYTILTAPKKRLQIIVEKLHFSGVDFYEIR